MSVKKKIQYYWSVKGDDGYEDETLDRYDTQEEAYNAMREAALDKMKWNTEFREDFYEKDDVIDYSVTFSKNEIVHKSYSGVYTYTIQSKTVFDIVPGDTKPSEERSYLAWVLIYDQMVYLAGVPCDIGYEICLEIADWFLNSDANNPSKPLYTAFWEWFENNVNDINAFVRGEIEARSQT